MKTGSVVTRSLALVVLLAAWLVPAVVAQGSAEVVHRLITFGCTGKIEAWTAPPGASPVEFRVAGAQGGANNLGEFGKGGQAEATFAVTAGHLYYVQVGCQGGAVGVGTGGAGYGRGGDGGAGVGDFGGLPGVSGAGGGGGSALRDFDATVLLLGGGGGGSAYAGSVRHPTGGFGGGDIGGHGGNSQLFGGEGGCKGSNNERAGQAGTAFTGGSGNGGGGGGGGWFGGESGRGDTTLYDASGGGGGCGHVADGLGAQMYSGVNTGDGFVRIKYDAPDRAPLVTGDSTSTPEDQAVDVDVLANDSDPDGDALGASVLGQPANGSAAVNADGTIRYTPNSNFHGGDSFVYLVTDSYGSSNFSTVNVTVTPVNDPPVATTDTATTPEDTPVTIDEVANDTDVDGDTPKVVEHGAPTYGKAVFNSDLTVTYTPPPNFNGSDSLTYQITDSHGGTATGTINVDVTPVDDPAVLQDDAYPAVEDASLAVDSAHGVLANDHDIDSPMSASLLGGVQHGSLTFNPDGSFTYTPVADYSGGDSFTYQVGSGPQGVQGQQQAVAGSTSADAVALPSATVTLTVAAANKPPVAVDDTASTGPAQPVPITVLANDSDPDGDALFVSTIGDPAHGTAVVSLDNVVTYTPAAGFSGGDSFVYTVSDGNGGLATATVRVSVAAAPVAVPTTTTTTTTLPSAVLSETQTPTPQLPRTGTGSGRLAATALALLLAGLVLEAHGRLRRRRWG